jgi:microcystin-dependent protein
MGAVNTTYTFTATDTITSTKMNNIIDETVMTADAVFGGSGGSGGLDIASGKLSISANAINSSRLATNSVTTNAITNGNVTPAKLSSGAPSWSTTSTSTNQTIEVGALIAANTTSTIDFHSVYPLNDFESRISRGSGENGIFTIKNTGTGTFIITQEDIGNISFRTSDTERMRIDSGGNICLAGGEPDSSYLPGFTTNYISSIQGVGTTYSNGAWLSLSQYSTSTSDSGGSFISLNKSNNATKGSHTIVTNNQQLGAIGWAGSNGTTFSGAANISVDVDGVPTSTSVPGRLIFSTTTAGGAVPTEKMRIDDAGNVGIGKTPTTKLDVNGTVTATEFAGPLTGNASTATTATTLATARTIAISGDVTGTATSFNGSANISIPVTIDNLSVTTAKIADGAVNQAKASNMLVPSGAIMAFAMNSAPAGWLQANGAAVSRTTYDDLFAAISTTYGVGNGSTTFNLPDLRGYFVRGSGTNSDGTASGTFGQKQADALGSHTHTITAGQQNGTSSGCGIDNTFQKAQDSSCGTVTTSSAGSTETRPNNIAMLYCIKI